MKNINMKLLALGWFIFIVIFIGLPITGSYNGEFGGYVLFTFLCLAVIVNLLALLSFNVSEKSAKVVKYVWVLLAIANLGVSLYTSVMEPSNDAFEFLGWSMTLLSFPIGVVLLYLFGAASGVINMVLPGGNISLVIFWLAFFALGYLQWFKWVPMLMANKRNIDHLRLWTEQEVRDEIIKIVEDYIPKDFTSRQLLHNNALLIHEIQMNPEDTTYLIYDIENKFGIDFLDGEFACRDDMSVQDMIDLVMKYIHQRAVNMGSLKPHDTTTARA
ncbi:MAG: hypothetical protein HZA22_12405 [Nitrospirae bacterium]|nr:hypothetical protein [Nitrospirota bacterium]